MQEVSRSVNRLTISMENNHQAILKRLRAIELQQMSTSKRLTQASCSTATTFSTSTSLSQETIRRSGDTNVVRKRRLTHSFIRLTFESDLAGSRVYKKIFTRNSTSSMFTTEEPKTTWSMISGLSVADIVSRISVLSLAIVSPEVYNSEQYVDTNPDQFAFERPSLNQAEEEPAKTLSYNTIDEKENVSLSTMLHYFFTHNFIPSEVSSELILSTALVDLGIHMLPWLRYPDFALYAVYRDDYHNCRWQMFAPGDRPMPRFVGWIYQGRCPMFMIRRRERPFDVTSGIMDKPMKDLGYSFECWPFGLVDAELALLRETILV